MVNFSEVSISLFYEYWDKYVEIIDSEKSILRKDWISWEFIDKKD